MASTGTDYGVSKYYKDEKTVNVDAEKKGAPENDTPRQSSVAGSVSPVYDTTHRKLKSRHIQLIGIGGTIGTALYVQIGRGLMNGGPGSLFLAFSLW
jgi:yeast amino acid transporter